MSKIKITESELRDLDDQSCGVCLNCHNVRDCCEPDAENYKCEACEQRKVMGSHWLIIMDLVDFVDNEDQSSLRW